MERSSSFLGSSRFFFDSSLVPQRSSQFFSCSSRFFSRVPLFFSGFLSGSFQVLFSFQTVLSFFLLVLLAQVPPGSYQVLRFLMVLLGYLSEFFKFFSASCVPLRFLLVVLRFFLASSRFFFCSSRFFSGSSQVFVRFFPISLMFRSGSSQFLLVPVRFFPVALEVPLRFLSGLWLVFWVDSFTFYHCCFFCYHCCYSSNLLEQSLSAAGESFSLRTSGWFVTLVIMVIWFWSGVLVPRRLSHSSLREPRVPRLFTLHLTLNSYKSKEDPRGSQTWETTRTFFTGPKVCRRDFCLVPLLMRWCA